MGINKSDDTALLLEHMIISYLLWEVNMTTDFRLLQNPNSTYASARFLRVSSHLVGMSFRIMLAESLTRK